VIGNIVWLLLAGWWFALGHLVTAILLAVTCSAAECCGCTTLPAASAACGAAFLSFSGALLLNNMSTSICRWHEMRG
jgi:hypothetical protein